MLNWDDLPEMMKNKEVKEYYDILNKKRGQLLIKRAFDLFCSLILCVFLLPAILLIAVLVKCESKGPILYRQDRVTKYGKIFKIFKFRTMVDNADKKGSRLTVENDSRITKVGKILRKVRLDEIPQLFNIVQGDMSFVGTRPEVPEYAMHYTKEMRATLLMPAGVTSAASIKFKDEDELLKESTNLKETYVNKILPQKMKHNLLYIKKFNFVYDVKLMLKTVLTVIK